MNNDLEQLRINRVKMRAENNAFFYVHLKRVLKSMAGSNRLTNRTLIEIPKEMLGLKPFTRYAKNIQAGMETHYDKRIASITQIVIWVKISDKFIK